MNITLSGNHEPTTYTPPLAPGEREDLRRELRWREQQYQDALWSDPVVSSTLIRALRERLEQVEDLFQDADGGAA